VCGGSSRELFDSSAKSSCVFDMISIAAAHRIVARNGQNGDRREQRTGTGPKRAKPVVDATAPNQLWSCYADVVIMPTSVCDPRFQAVDGTKRSA
jgi:hypothetical protein